ncbi:hypothetical protein [Algoriphagus aquimarinus]|uniref:hypothetical protein n=1 Tax=Algoriphagus aquimarinus TaxID=237018 RepID=UPI001114126B|nr:hypothetical protein [Algoriphagus aquimarinus]
MKIPENIAVTLRSINQSKGKKDPELWIQDSRLILTTKINLGIAGKAIEFAKSAIEKKASQF